MNKSMLGARIQYKTMIYLSSAVIPLSFILVLFTAGGHAPAILTLPALFFFGPLWFLAPQGGISGLVFAIFAAYPLYLSYGCIFVALSESREKARLALIVAVTVLHVVSGLGIWVYKF